MCFSSRIAVALVSFSMLVAGCASESVAPDPTSAQALKKAEPLEVSCSYEEHISGSAGGSDLDQCEEQRCNDVKDPDFSGVSIEIGDYTTGYNHDKVDYVGGCGSSTRTKVTCDDLASDGDGCDACVAKSCCTSVFLCDHDPNCGAITDCINNECKDDESCMKRCIDNGEPSAAESFKAALSCMSGTCASACAQR